jgi:hypothetical protein
VTGAYHLQLQRRVWTVLSAVLAEQPMQVDVNAYWETDLGASRLTVDASVEAPSGGRYAIKFWFRHHEGLDAIWPRTAAVFDRLRAECLK